MWQTKYAFAVSKNLEVGVNFRQCKEGYFLSGCPCLRVFRMIYTHSSEKWAHFLDTPPIFLYHLDFVYQTKWNCPKSLALAAQ